MFKRVLISVSLLAIGAGVGAKALASLDAHQARYEAHIAADAKSIAQSMRDAGAKDDTDPNDCSRGIDEANESECLGGGQ